MIDSIIKGFEVWTDAQGVKSKGRVKSIGNISLEGIVRLRELILELAIQGKLVMQDSNDEPASSLLRQIAAEKEELIKEGKIKKSNLLPELAHLENPFEIPSSWEWTRLGCICTKLTDGSHNPPIDSGNGLPMLSSQNVTNGKIDFANPSRYVSEKDFEIEDQRTQIQPNDVLLTIVATIGRSAVVPKTAPKFVIQRSVAVLQSKLNPYFLSMQLVSPHCMLYFDTNSKGTAQKGIYLAKLGLMEIVIPPLAEQHRIVAKVDELMKLCDKLEEEQTKNLTTHHHLVKCLLETLTQANDADELQSTWEKISQHFDTLFCTVDSIEQLKQTILQLAVMGKLVKQDPNDEPANELIQRIAREKEILIKDGKISKQKELPIITENNVPFKIPESWAWCRLGLVTDIIAGASFQSEAFNTNGGTKCIKITNAGVGEFIETEDYLPESFIKKYNSYLVKEGDLILALTRPYISSGLKISICPSSYNNSLLNQRVAAIRSVSSLLSQLYVFTFIQSPHVLSFYKSKFDDKSQQPNMKMGDITDLVFALPPSFEQQRILARAKELLTLCDSLKEKISKSEEIKNALSYTVIEVAS